MFSYAFYIAAAAMALASTTFRSLGGLVMSCALLLVSAVYFKSGHIVNNLLVRKSKIIEMGGGMKLNGNLASLTRRSGPAFESISMALLRFDGAVDSSADTMRSLLESIREPFEFSFSAVQVDKARLLDALDARRRMREISLSRVSPQKYARANQLKREIQLIESEMNAIRASGKAFDTRIRLKAMATAESEPEAARRSLRSLERICDAFIAATRLNYEIIKGEDLLRLAGDHS